MMESFITKNGKKLRRGFTTGSCAAAASKAAAMTLLTGTEMGKVFLMTPGGIGLDLEVLDMKKGDGFVSCGIRKDSGDDPDVTNGLIIYARVEKIPGYGKIDIDGGEGIGRVTKAGLDQPEGNAAINSTPRRMISRELLQLIEESGYTGGLRVTISAPGGAELARKTFNPRLGIEGGISILGTTGIVEPMSDEAVVETIRAELSVRAHEGSKTVLFVPGNYGADFIKTSLGIDPERAVMTSNFIGDAFEMAGEAGFERALLIGHIGKIVKLAGGLFNTHSRYGDCRQEIFASHAALMGAGSGTVREIMDSAMTDGMIDILEKQGLTRPVMKSIMEKIEVNLRTRPSIRIKTGVITFSNVYGVLGMTRDAMAMLEMIKKDGIT